MRYPYTLKLGDSSLVLERVIERVEQGTEVITIRFAESTVSQLESLLDSCSETTFCLFDENGRPLVEYRNAMVFALQRTGGSTKPLRAEITLHSVPGEVLTVVDVAT